MSWLTGYYPSILEYLLLLALRRTLLCSLGWPQTQGSLASASQTAGFAAYARPWEALALPLSHDSQLKTWLG